MNADWLDALERLRSDGDLPEGAPDGPAPEPSAAKKPKLTISFERKGRGGKSATIVSGFDPDDHDGLSRLASTIKQRLATGGSARGGEILIQGDRRDDLKRLLTQLGYRI